ncbi:MAG: NAD(P)/FAD-dependent oxidoreductase [Vagococcus sp.]
MNHDIYDITIIGGGPSGLFAAFYAGMRQAKTKIIEALPELGGQLSLLYPEKYIYDVAGFPTIKAQDLVNSLTKQIEPFHHAICLEEQVQTLTHLEDGTIEIHTTKGTHLSKTVIIAAGNGAFQPRRLNLAGHDSIEGTHLHYYIKDLSLFKDKHVAVCGGGDSAVDWALMLEKVAKSVSIVHRRPEFRAHEHSVNRLMASTISVKTPFVIDQLNMTDTVLTSLTIKNPKEGIEEQLTIDHLIVNYGFSSSLGPIKKWDLSFKGSNIAVHSDMSTTLDGVFAIGDIATYDGKVALIATGFGEAPTAVNNAVHYINPKERLQPMHSTSLYDV